MLNDFQFTADMKVEANSGGTTIDFNRWLDCGNEPNGYEDAYALYLAAIGTGGLPPYKCTEVESTGHIYIKGPGESSLAIVSNKAKDYFIRMIRRRYMDGDGPDSMTPDGWYYFMHEMSKPD